MESSRRGLQLCFRPRHDRTLQSGDIGVQSPGTPTQDSNPGQFRDSHAGVPRKIAIWMPPPPRAAEYTIRGKVLASSPKGVRWWLTPKPGVWCVKVSPSSPVAVPTPKRVPNEFKKGVRWWFTLKVRAVHLPSTKCAPNLGQPLGVANGGSV